MTYEKNQELKKEKEKDLKPPDSKSKTNLLEDCQITKNSQILKTEDNLCDSLSTSRKFSFSLNRWEIKDKNFPEKATHNSFSSPYQIMDENLCNNNNSNSNLKTSNNCHSNNINNNGCSVANKLKSVFVQRDYNSFLNIKLNGFKEYNIKKGPYLEQEKKSKVEVFSYLFNQNLIKTNSKKVMEIRLKKIADIIRKKKLEVAYFCRGKPRRSREKQRPGKKNLA